MLPLFSYERDGLAIVTNRFHLICRALKANGRLALDEASFLAMRYSGDPLSTQLATFETPALGVSMPPVGSVLTLRRGGVAIDEPVDEPGDGPL